ncbi:MAG: hypothetical protein ACRC62_08185 [Microcoleus sp.]
MTPTAVLNQILNKVRFDRPQVNYRDKMRDTAAIVQISMQAIFWLYLKASIHQCVSVKAEPVTGDSGS